MTLRELKWAADAAERSHWDSISVLSATFQNVMRSKGPSVDPLDLNPYRKRRQRAEFPITILKKLLT